jgi:hypothetical protein
LRSERYATGSTAAPFWLHSSAGCAQLGGECACVLSNANAARVNINVVRFLRSAVSAAVHFTLLSILFYDFGEFRSRTLKMRLLRNYIIYICTQKHKIYIKSASSLSVKIQRHKRGVVGGGAHLTDLLSPFYPSANSLFIFLFASIN